MNDTGWGLLLNLFLWIGVTSAMLFFGVWACIELFLGTAEKVQKAIRAVSRRKTSPDSSQTSEDEEEPYWNPS